MKIIFSPSKSQQISSYFTYTRKTKPKYESLAQDLLMHIKKYLIPELQKMFKTSEAKTQEILSFYNITETQPAIDTFTGTSFNQLELHHYGSEEKKYLQDHLIILSALYGVLRPADAISPYRLDMKDTIDIPIKEKNLYAFWNDKVNNYFKNEDIIINLASEEYSKMIDSKISAQIITIHFLVKSKEKYKSIAVYAKQQRGKLLNYMIQQQISEVVDLKKYFSDNFYYDKNKSDKNNYYFVRID